MLRNFIVVIIFLSALVNIITCPVVTIKNVIPRPDTHEQRMNAHDDNICLYDGLSYYDGSSYSICEEPSGISGYTIWPTDGCGFQLIHSFSLYTLIDLSEWILRGYVFQMSSMKTSEIMCDPRILSNPGTKH
jgi:hypothetical protein